MMDWKYAFITKLLHTQQCTENINTTAFPYLTSSVQRQRNIVMSNIQLCLVHELCTSCVTYIRCSKFSKAKTGSYINIQLAFNSSQYGSRTHADGPVIRLCTPHACSPITACRVKLHHLKTVIGIILYFNQMSNFMNNKGREKLYWKNIIPPSKCHLVINNCHNKLKLICQV